MKLFIFIALSLFLSTANAQIIKESENIKKDTKTNLLWQDTKIVNSKKMNFKEAKKYCENLDLDGQKNWLVPGFLELFSLVDTKVYNPTISKKFKYIASDNYWSTKTFSHAMSDEAFVVNFLSGAFNREKMSDSFFVRCYKKN